MLKEAAANAAGPNATLSGTLQPTGAAAPVGSVEAEQELKENSEVVQNTGSQ